MAFGISETVTAGGSTSYTTTETSVNGLTGTVNFSVRSSRAVRMWFQREQLVELKVCLTWQ